MIGRYKYLGIIISRYKPCRSLYTYSDATYSDLYIGGYNIIATDDQSL